MRHRPKPSASCRPRKSGPCGKPKGKGKTLADLIHEYKREYGEPHRADREGGRDFDNLTEAIKHATGSVGKVPDHQRRVGRKILTKACNRLLRLKDEINACESFADLIDLIEEHTSDIYRFGTLAVYDTACRLGVYLGLEPEVVYLHAGTAKGAKALGLDTSRGYLEIGELPKPLGMLEPWECEDFMCIYKVELAKLKGKS
jgi:hypothetical protein